MTRIRSMDGTERAEEFDPTKMKYVAHEADMNKYTKEDMDREDNELDEI